MSELEHRASWDDCPWSYQDSDIVEVTDRMEDHQLQEQHDVDFERGVVAGGSP